MQHLALQCIGSAVHCGRYVLLLTYLSLEVSLSESSQTSVNSNVAQQQLSTTCERPLGMAFVIGYALCRNRKHIYLFSCRMLQDTASGSADHCIMGEVHSIFWQADKCLQYSYCIACH